MSSCPCGSGRSLDECCGRYLSGKAQAPTAEALMRARYSAHVTANIDFIERTRARETRDSFDRAGATKWAKDSDWKGLTITSVEGVTRTLVLGAVPTMVMNERLSVAMVSMPTVTSPPEPGQPSTT